MRLSILVWFVFSMAFTNVVYAEVGNLRVEEVTIDNYKEFEAQIRRDLSIGTKIDEVRSYLQEHGIVYGDVGHFESISVSLEIDRTLLFFTTHLSIDFNFDGDELILTSIDANLINTAF
ncbi:MAG: hypothetical protein MI806_22845 [Minwuiales bacterium]|nr:hypothetical protein [Minwuiales bacterium]